ncbi:uncharacterized protein PHALS_03885 [Plasmopara halstedii]|uniref:Uncharacterized protein n=1 Tax=Plasmopara halstedii TaxID=4781 RepID=A0A0P1AXS6_PLAHL|nr:uncharacterized protein PHALS_03885 [Plasmopara halstedii]CEG47238.1 hypothetical protein PHALS_03885 [Plasmopara halstedii]|eukprot:XP_024583607.1 hypothetical protein PHALS_03885 [Plasmopara halstedii]
MSLSPRLFYFSMSSPALKQQTRHKAALNRLHRLMGKKTLIHSCNKVTPELHSDLSAS